MSYKEALQEGFTINVGKLVLLQEAHTTINTIMATTSFILMVLITLGIK